MSGIEVLKILSDAVVLSYERSFDRLVVSLRLWNEEAASLVVDGVTWLEDTGTWECDGVVRLSTLDTTDGYGFGIVDTDSNSTLRFVARRVIFISPSGQEEPLDG